MWLEKRRTRTDLASQERLGAAPLGETERDKAGRA